MNIYVGNMSYDLNEDELREAFEAFAEKLRRSYWVRTLTYDQLIAHLDKIPAPFAKRADVIRLRQLLVTARRLDNRGDKYAQIVPVDRMDFDRVPVLR